jgi:hypothetical protein
MGLGTVDSVFRIRNILKRIRIIRLISGPCGSESFPFIQHVCCAIVRENFKVQKIAYTVPYGALLPYMLKSRKRNVVETRFACLRVYWRTRGYGTWTWFVFMYIYSVQSQL